jgi:predicted 3-demethylubiquinone-9 3-methyltransferase (glyoxalase superfamily)
MTMAALTTCLWFDTQAEEAANHYSSIFEDAKIGNVTRYPEGGPGPAGTVMTVDFEIWGQKFVALNGGPAFTFNESVSFQVPCETQDEVDYYWSKLSEGGAEGMCGWLKDKFGISWQVVPNALIELMTDPDTEKVARVMKTFGDMRKIDIAAVQAAAAHE